MADNKKPKVVIVGTVGNMFTNELVKHIIDKQRTSTIIVAKPQITIKPNERSIQPTTKTKNTK